MSGLKCRQDLPAREYQLGRFGTVEICGVKSKESRDELPNRLLTGDETDLQLTDMDGNVVRGAEARKRLGFSQTGLYTGEVVVRYLTSPRGLAGLLRHVDSQNLPSGLANGEADAEELDLRRRMGTYFAGQRFRDQWCAAEKGTEPGTTLETVNLATGNDDEGCFFSDTYRLLNVFFTSSQKTRLVQEWLNPLQSTVAALQKDPSAGALEFRSVHPSAFMDYAALLESPLNLLFTDKSIYRPLVSNYSAAYEKVNADLNSRQQKAEALIAAIKPDHLAMQAVGVCFKKLGEEDGVKAWDMSHECYLKMNNLIAKGKFEASRENVAKLAELADGLRRNYPNYATQLTDDLELLSAGRRVELSYQDSNWYQMTNVLTKLFWVQQPLEIRCDAEDDDCEDELPRLSWNPEKNKTRFQNRQISLNN